MNETRKPIVVVGSVTMDMVTRTPQIPRIGQTVIGTSFSTTPGGKGANQAVAAARLGYPVQLVGMVGDDVYGPQLLDNLFHAGVDTSAMLAASGLLGPRAHLPCRKRRERHRRRSRRQRQGGLRLRRQASPRHPLRRNGPVPARTPHGNHRSHARPLRAIRCPRHARPCSRRRAASDPVWKQVAWFTPNETEAAFYLDGGSDPEPAARELLARGLRGVVLKRGAEGAYVAVAGGKAGWVQPFAVDAIDTVAAGDCFNGAFAVALLEGKDPWAAARFACAAAAISVTRHGAQASMPSRADLKSFLASRG